MWNADCMRFLDYSSEILYSLLVGPLTTLRFVTAGPWACRSAGFKVSIPFPHLLTGTCIKRNILQYQVTGNVKAILEVVV